MFDRRAWSRTESRAIVTSMGRLLVFALFLALLGCGTNITRKDVNEPCTRDAQCKDGLDCLAGVCVLDVDAGLDAAVDSGGGS